MGTAAPGYQVLSQVQVNKLASVEGNGVGTGVLPSLLDQALSSGSSASTAAAAAQTTASAAVPTSKLVVRSGTVPSGSATPTAAVTGLLTTDTVLAVSQSAPGANNLALLGFTLASGKPAVAGQLPLKYFADPGAGGTIAVLVLAQ